MSEPKPTVFVVDDDASVRESLKLLIESAGWQAETFGSGQEFLARPRVLAPSCLVLDVLLPDLNGCDLQKLVADRADMPIIFITGHERRADDSPRHESWSRGLFHQAVSWRRALERNPARP